MGSESILAVQIFYVTLLVIVGVAIIVAKLDLIIGMLRDRAREEANRE